MGNLADKMCFLSVTLLLLFLFCMVNGKECNDGTIVVLAGMSVSLEWKFSNIMLGNDLGFTIYHSSNGELAEMTEQKCIVSDHSSTYCSISYTNNTTFTASLIIMNVNAGQSGNYTLRLMKGSTYVHNSSKFLEVIGKPNVMEVGKPILDQKFDMTCNSSHQLECLVFRWRINGTPTNQHWNRNVYSVPILLMGHNLSNVTCQVCLNETGMDISSVIDGHERCSTDSDPYAIPVIYGPHNISLSLNESSFDLVEKELFTVECLAYCNPNCTFLWNGSYTTESKNLTIASFESKMSGQYTCYVTNIQRNVTSKSNTITLRHVKVDKSVKEDTGVEFQTAVIGMGLVGVSVLLVIIGFSLVIRWSKNISNKIDSSTLTRQEVNIRTPTHGEILQGISRIQNRPLPVPNTRETKSRRPYRQMCSYDKRKSRSLHNLLDSPQDIFYPLRGELSLQLLYSPATIMQRSHRHDTQDNDSMKKRRFSNCEENQRSNISDFENGIKLEFIYAKVRKDKRSDTAEHTDVAKSDSQCNVQHESFKQESQENLYSTINEDVLSVFDGARNNITSENSNERQIYTRQGESD